MNDDYAAEMAAMEAEAEAEAMMMAEAEAAEAEYQQSLEAEAAEAERQLMEEDAAYARETAEVCNETQEEREYRESLEKEFYAEDGLSEMMADIGTDQE